MKTYLNYINGEWIPSSSGETFEVRNPANQQLLATVQKSNSADIDSAIDSARHAFDKGPWPEMTPAERCSILWKLADLVEKNASKLALLESKNVGKTIKYATDSDLPFIIDNLRFFATACRMLEGKSAAEYADFHSRRHHKGLGTSIIRREPIGVVGAVVPWNYPLFIAVWKIAPALAAGNTSVVKPASLTPLTLLEFCSFAEQAGIPKGVLNVVTGPGEQLGAELAESSKVDMLALTGDTETGKKVMSLASSTLKRVHLELGGKAPMIVLPDSDLEAAAEGAAVGAFWNTGQDCTAVTRVYIHERQHAQFVKMLAKIASRFRLGDPLKRTTDMGPLVSEKQRLRVESYIESGLKQGAKIAYGGKRPKGKIFDNGFFFEPTILANVAHYSKVCQEEIFGPVLAVFPYKKVEEAIHKANDVKYGLAASVWGSNIQQLLTISKQLHFGTVWINEHGILCSEMPHGGFKQSGFGKDLSMYSLEEYTNIKHVYIDLTGMKRKPWHYVVYGKP